MGGFWTARELAEYLGIPISTLTYWVATDLVTPDEPGRGRGGHKIGLLGLLEALAVKELRSSDVSLRKIKEVAANLKVLFDEKRPLAKLTLVVYGNDVHVKLEGVEEMRLSALMKPGQSVMIFPLGQAYDQKLKEWEKLKELEVGDRELATVG